MTDATPSAAVAQSGPADQIPEQFLLSPEQRDFAATLGAYLERHYGHDELRRALDEGATGEQERWQLMASELGLPAALVPADSGGLGFGALEAMVIAQELGRVLYQGPWLASCVLAGTALAAAGGPEASAVLGAIASGQATACLADDEVMTRRRDAQAPVVQATGEGGYVVRGRARFVLDGVTADHVLVVGQDDDGGSLYRVSERGPLGLETLETLDLTRPITAITFDAAPATRIGPPGAAAAVRQAVHLLAGLVSAAEGLGGMERCLDMATEYAKTRIQYGRVIGSYQAIKHKLADLLVLVEITRTAVQHAAWSIAAGDPDAALAVHAAQVQAGSGYLRLTAENIQVHGGIGFTFDHDAHLYFRRAKSMQLLFGSPDFHRDEIADLVGI
jgi:alkylation response protein AidB-like acyl-CoA dehydrogenase